MARGASRAKLPADSDAAAAGHVEQALADFDASLGLQEQAPTYNAMGNVLKAARRGEEAMQAYESALELDPEFAVAHFNLGALRHAQGCVARLQSSPAASCLCSFAPLPSRRVRPSLFESVCGRPSIVADWMVLRSKTLSGADTCMNVRAGWLKRRRRRSARR